MSTQTLIRYCKIIFSFQYLVLAQSSTKKNLAALQTAQIPVLGYFLAICYFKKMAPAIGLFLVFINTPLLSLLPKKNLDTLRAAQTLG